MRKAMLKRIVVLCVSLVAWLFGTPVEAAEFHCAAGDVACLVDAINQSNSNGEANTIRLAAGTYSLTVIDHGEPLSGATGLPTIVGSVAIIGSGAEATIIQRTNDDVSFVSLQPPIFRLFEVATSGKLDLEHLTVRRGNAGTAGRGGAISSTGVLRIANAVIKDNYAGLAAAIYAPTGELSVSDSRLINNQGAPGGIIVAIGFCTSSCTASNMTATIARSSFFNNGSGASGIINIDNDAAVTIRDSDFTGNGAHSAGVITVVGQGPVTITNTTIVGTFGSFSARAISQIPLRGSGNVLVTNSTIVNNVGGISGRGDLRIQNSIVAGNNQFGDCQALGFEGGVVSLGHNLFGNPANCGAQPSDLTGDARLGVDALLGASVDSGRPGGGYVPLLPDSRAIDGGDAAACPVSDQRGLARNIDGNGDGIRRCDIGAVEFYPVVNDRVQLEGLQYSFVKPSNLGFTDPRASAGAFRITALFRNNGPDICHVAFDVPTLDGPAGTNPVLLTAARELLGGQNTAVSAAKAGAQPHLPSGGIGSYQFTIGVQQRTPINFLVNALGDATSGLCGQ
jgi:hypothetical protein